MTTISTAPNGRSTIAPQEIVFVFDNLPDWRVLAAAVNDGAELVVLDGARDGLDQIAAHLEGRSGIGVIHILSHGEAGRVQLGSSSVGVQEAQARAALLARIGDSLTVDGDILLYGCDVASGDAGRQFIEQLATLTGADVAASVDATGLALRGGNWQLEAHAGTVESPHALAAQEALQDYAHLLAVTYSTATNPLAAVPRTAQSTIVGDFDSDGDVDVLSYSADYLSLWFYRNDGAGGFTAVNAADPSTPFRNLAVADHFYNSETTYVADFDGDGDLDIWDYAGDDHLLSSNPSVNGPGIYLQNQGGTYARLSGNANPLKDVASFKDFAIHGDFDGDGDIDVLAYKEGGLSLGYYENNGSGTFAEVAYSSSPFRNVALGDQFWSASQTHVADFDGDGDLDVWDATGDSGHGGTPVYLQNNSGLYVRLTGAANPLNGVALTNNMAYAIHGDFDTDGDIDVLAYKSDGLTPEFLRNNGSGQFTSVALAASPFAGISEPYWNPTSTYVADFDNDGDVDIWDYQGHTAGIYTQQLGAPPKLSSSTPTDNASGVHPGAALVLQFNETVTAGTGSIRIYRTSDNALIQTIAANGPNVTGSGTTITVNPPAPLADLTGYYLLIDNQAFHDVDGMVFVGISDQTQLNFTTGSSNTEPTATNLTQTVTYTEDPGGTVTLGDIVVTDPDSGDTVTATLTLSNPNAGSLTTGTFGAATSTYNAGTALWQVTGTVADVNAALAAVAFAPAPHWDQNITIATRVRDAANTGPADGTVSLNVTPVNDAPTATQLTQTVAYTEDPVGNVALGNSVVTDPDSGDAVTATLTLSDPAAGSLTTGTFGVATSTYNAGTGQWQVTGTVADVNAALAAVAFAPAPNWDQNITITTSVRDAASTGPADGTISLNVTPVNDAPVAAPDALTVAEGGTATVLTGGATSVLANDVDAEGEPLTAALVAGPAHGTLNLNPDGTFSYTHDGSDTTTDSFTYRANDGTSNGNTVTVTITVTPVNDAPVGVADSITVAEGGTATVLAGGATSVLANDTDIENNPLTAALVTGPANGTLALNANGTFSYTHNGSETTADSFTYIPHDGTANGNTTTVSITVTPVNDAPAGVADSVTVAEGGTVTVLAGGATSVLANDWDTESDPLTAVLVTGPANGTLTLNSNGTFSYTHNGSETTTDSFTYRPHDGSAAGNPVTVTITVTPLNDAPTVANAIPNQNATQDSAFNFQFAANTFADADVGDTLTYIAHLSGGSALPAWLAFNPVTRTFSGTPANGDVGTISIAVTADDGNGGTVTDTFDIVVANTNDAPTVANAIPNQNATEDAVFSFQFAANAFEDVDVGDTLTYSAQLSGGGALPAWLNFDGSTRTFSGTPANGDVGTISIAVIANDGNGGTVTDTFDIVVANTNDAPTVAHAIPNQNATEDAAFGFQFAANTFDDVDAGETLTYSAQLSGGGALPTWLNFDPVSRTFSGTPLNDHVGTLSIDVTAEDGNGGTVTDTFDIVVANTNDDPTVANAIPNRNATIGTAVSFAFAANTFEDVDIGDVLTYTAQLSGGGALPGWLSFDATTRTFSGTPAGGDAGTLSIDVMADDGNGGTAVDTFDLVVAAPPVIPDPEEPTPPTPPTPPVVPGIPDNDGVPNPLEDSVPGIPGPDGRTLDGDGNGDGIKDSEQPTVASIGFVLSPTAESDPGNAPPSFTTLVASSRDGKVASGTDNSRILSLTQLDAPQDVPAGMQTPLGLVSFTVALAQGKTGEDFSLYLDPALGINGYWKQDASGTWVNLASEPYGGETVMEGGRIRLDFHIEDGGQFDADGKVDGIITDPGAPAHLPLSLVGWAPDVPNGTFWF